MTRKRPMDTWNICCLNWLQPAQTLGSLGEQPNYYCHCPLDCNYIVFIHPYPVLISSWDSYTWLYKAEKYLPLGSLMDPDLRTSTGLHSPCHKSWLPISPLHQEADMQVSHKMPAKLPTQPWNRQVPHLGPLVPPATHVSLYTDIFSALPHAMLSICILPTFINTVLHWHCP